MVLGPKEGEGKWGAGMIWVPLGAQPPSQGLLRLLGQCEGSGPSQ